MSVSIMDSPVSPRTDANINDVSGFYFKIEHDASFPSTVKKKTTVVKYTKLPDFDFENKVCDALKPRLRRIIELDDPQLQTSRSLKLETVSQSKMNPNTKRKIVSISENEENKITTPSVGRITNYTNRSSGTASKSPVSRNTSRLTNPSKYTRDLKLSAQPGNAMNKKEYVAPKATIRSKQAFVSNHTQHDHLRSRNTKEHLQANKNTSNPSKVNLSKNLVIPCESEKVLTSIKNELVKSLNKTPSKRLLERNRRNTRIPENKNKNDLLKDIPCKPIPVIHVPIENTYENILKLENMGTKSDIPILITDSVDCGTDIDQQFLPKDANVGTPPLPTMVHEETETSNNNLTTDMTQDIFDNLDIPNVTLVKDKSNFAKDKVVKFCSQSLPNLKVPSFKISPEKENDGTSVGLGKSKTYIISRATFTYTTKQKINFHVVGSSDDSQSNQSPSPLAYPLSVVSLLKKNLNHCDISETSEEERLPNKKDESSICHNDVDELQALTSRDNNDKLVKPSDLISTIRVNNGLLHNDYISEQFQRELHFIDSFFESLQYLESCSINEKCFSEATSENWVSKTRLDLKNFEYNSFLSKLENGAGALTHVDDIETMASKSLCLLNLLIRDEQRRAKNLLFVLKMREDALKDFTKSQIIWLENKKKQENTDVSTLKKKQRGALLKLQHECGEMQRMRKALLTLSEKRKAALMKTRNNIELKLNNNVNVDQILLGKKKLKRNTAADRNVAPLKCFDLSSSGCEESASSKSKLEISVVPQELAPTNSRAEKCVQTGDSIFEPTKVDRMTDTADENFVAVDGGYLNILFQHLALPQIFSSGKQYEVNEEALKNIVESSNKPHPKDHFDTDVVENFMDKIRNRDSDRSSSLSTAHSLVDEFDQYYKGLSDGSKSSLDSPDNEYHMYTSSPQAQVYEITESYVQAIDTKPEQSDKNCGVSTGTVIGSVEHVTSSDTLICESSVFESSYQIESTTLKTTDESVFSGQTGPLPVPPGAVSPEPLGTDDSGSPTISSGITDIGSRSDGRDSIISLTTLSPSQSEAEELRRQQLAIEREIKALEQQQNQLLVVREIPDKPPPPYTPPNNAAQKTSPMFVMTEDVEEKIHMHVTHGDVFTCDPSDPFSVFIKDICEESLARQKLELSEEPWDACNLLPCQQEATPDKRGQKTIAEINQILSGVPPTVVSGVGARRSDHIDDILFAEWRRCEPEWTALQADEAAVKTQVFENLFQRVLSETIDQYKQIVLGLASPDNVSEKPTKKKSIHTKLGES